MANRKIIPHLWFDKEAKEAAEFYTAAFGSDSKMLGTVTLHNTPSDSSDPNTPAGDTEIVSFELLGQPFMAMSAGPLFKFNPSISFFVNFDPSKDAEAKEKLDALWGKLSEGGKALMELAEYPFSKHYGWVEDKFGLSWQLMLTDPSGDPRAAIVPSLLFTGNVRGKAAEAVDFYLSVFKNSKKGMVSPYAEGQAQSPEAKTAYADFMIEDYWIAAMDSGVEHDHPFNEAISIIVNTKDQEETDYYWEKLSAVPESEACGWLKDKYGVSWQITPIELEEMMASANDEQMARITEAILPMKKLDLKALKEAYEGK